MFIGGTIWLLTHGQKSYKATKQVVPQKETGPYVKVKVISYIPSTLLTRPPSVPFYPFSGEGSPTKIDYRKQKVQVDQSTSLLEDPTKVIQKRSGRDRPAAAHHHRA